MYPTLCAKEKKTKKKWKIDFTKGFISWEQQKDSRTDFEEDNKTIGPCKEGGTRVIKKGEIHNCIPVPNTMGHISHKYIVNIGLNRSVIYIANLLDTYSETIGACRGGNSSSNNAGSITYADRDCKSRCGISSGCSGYALPTDSTLETCETYTSFGSTGDGNDDYRCYSKEKGNTVSQNYISFQYKIYMI